MISYKRLRTEASNHIEVSCLRSSNTMKGRIALYLLACCASFIASLPLKHKPIVAKPQLTEMDLDHSSVFALILEANKNYVSDLNNMVTQGDILVKRTGRLAINCTSCLWPKAADGTVRVPFILNPTGYSVNNLALIRNAMYEYETLTCVRFVNRSTESNYVTISSGNGCMAFVGRIGGAQAVNLSSPGCMLRGIIQHELLHTLGFYHEVSRSDRNNYVFIRTDYINPGDLYNFNVISGNTLGLPYDYTSVMHHNKYAYTTNNSVATIVPIPDPNVPIGQRYGLSVLDVKKINKLYNCSVCAYLLNEESGTITSTNFTTGYPNNMNCVWLIRVPYGQVALTFNYFNVQNTPACDADYVRIYDGPTRSSPVLLDKICGTVIYPTITSSTDQMLIEFVSDGSVTSAGFNASYQSVPCGGFFAANNTDVTSPGYYSGGYPPNMDCNYLIYAPVGYRISLFGSCELEAPIYLNICYYDVLTIYPDVNSTDRKYIYCDQVTIPTIYSTSNQMLINFVSDFSNEYRGFKVTYSFVL